MSGAHKHLPTAQEVTMSAAAANKVVVPLGIMGLLGMAASLGIGLTSDKEQFFFSYLTAFMFCLSLSLGGLFFTVIQHLVGAQWSVVVRRIAENLMSNFVVLAVLFLPILLGLHELYHWTHAEVVANDHILTAKAPYLNQSFFMIRLVVYFVLWIGLSAYFYKRSVQVDTSGDVNLIKQMRGMAAPAVLIYGLSQTFAAFDLLMSLDPHWFSTIFGVYFFAGSAVTTFSLIALIALMLRRAGYLTDVISSEHYHDLGKLMFAFTVFWTYIAFSQYFLIWYANLPEETLWFLHRWEGSWKGVSLLILIGHFIVPFAVLMSRHVKRALPVLGLMACWMIFMHLVDIHWMVMPTHHKEGIHISLLDITCLMGVVGIWGAMVARRFSQAALVPVGDPYLPTSMEFENV